MLPLASLAMKETHLEDDGALKNDEHEEGEKRVVPVLVEHPQADAEDLEHKKGRDGVLGKEAEERRHGDVKRVGAVAAEGELDGLFGGEAPALLELAERRLAVCRVG